MAGGIITLLKGAFVGATMLVPGVSGGSMAMILGVYDRLISAISSFRRNVRHNLAFLLLFVLGALAGMLLFARPLESLIDRYPRPMLYLFLGAVAGGVPMMYGKAQICEPSLRHSGWMLLGLAAAVGVELLPVGVFAVGGGWQAQLALLLAGALAAVAMILPGISVSYFLLVLGLYSGIIDAVGRMDWAYLLPFGLGLLAGTLLTTRALERAMQRHPQPTYLIILGFVLAGMVQAFPGLAHGMEWLLCLPLAAIGFGSIYALSRAEHRGDE